MSTLENFLSEFISSDINNHPDIKLIFPEKTIISIDTIRSARSWLSMTPISSDKKVLIIDRAHAMNTEAQNAFLKILEEPAENTYIFLIINHKDQVLPTVYSRTVPIYFSLKREESVNADSSLIDEIMGARDAQTRMRIWTQAKMDKDKIHEWLRQSVPVLRKDIITNRSKKTAQATRDLLERLSNPKSQNWQLTAENLIISI